MAIEFVSYGRSIGLKTTHTLVAVGLTSFDVTLGKWLDVRILWLGETGETRARNFFDAERDDSGAWCNLQLWAGRSTAMIAWARKVPAATAA
jgi:hypothetical protein